MSKARKMAQQLGYQVDEEKTAEFRRRLRAANKKAVTIRLPQEVIEAFKKKAGEDGKYQALMREVLIDSLKAS
jgi:predicted DNA binding CopG/RHH family protein